MELMELWDQGKLNVYFEDLPNDPYIAAHKICLSVEAIVDKKNASQEAALYELFFELYAFSKVLLNNIGLAPSSLPSVSSQSKVKSVREIARYFSELNGKLQPDLVTLAAAEYETGYAVKFSKGIVYEFSDGDLARIQDLINKLRTYLSETESFDDEHRRRLLLRLEKLQSELHKNMSDFDRFWGLFVDGGVAIGKFGKNAKPFVELLREIKEIVAPAQARAEGLASNAQIELSDNQAEDA